jgi:hypothetical protein
MFQNPSSRFISNSPLYIAGPCPIRGFVNLMQIIPTPETENFSQPPVLFYEMDFVDASQKLILGLN